TARRDRLDGVGYDLRARPRPAGDRGVGGHLVLARGARRDAARRLADRAARQGRARPRGPGEQVPRQPAPRGSRGALPGGPGAEQPGHPALLPGRAPLRADVGRCAGVDVARAGAPGARPGRAVRELHLRVRARPGHDPAFAARLSTLPLRRPAQPLPGEGARRHARAPAATGRAGVVTRGCQTLVVTLGPRGVAYFTGRPVRSARIASDAAPDPEGDPTGCGDVLGATVVASLVTGVALEEALRL